MPSLRGVSSLAMGFRVEEVRFLDSGRDLRTSRKQGPDPLIGFRSLRFHVKGDQVCFQTPKHSQVNIPSKKKYWLSSTWLIRLRLGHRPVNYVRPGRITLA